MKKAIIISLTLIVGLLAGCQKQVDQYETAKGKALVIEAETNLPAMAAAQMGYKAMNQKYAQTFQEMGFSLSSQNQNYSYFMGEDVIKGWRGPAKLPADLPMTTPTADSYVIYAVARLSDDLKDTKLDIWKIDQNGGVTRVRSGI